MGSNVCGSEGWQGCPHPPQACLGVGLCLSPFTGLSPKWLGARLWLINSSYGNDNYYLLSVRHLAYILLILPITCGGSSQLVGTLPLSGALSRTSGVTCG